MTQKTDANQSKSFVKDLLKLAIMIVVFVAAVIIFKAIL